MVIEPIAEFVGQICLADRSVLHKHYLLVMPSELGLYFGMGFIHLWQYCQVIYHVVLAMQFPHEWVCVSSAKCEPHMGSRFFEDRHSWLFIVHLSTVPPIMWQILDRGYVWVCSICIYVCTVHIYVYAVCVFGSPDLLLNQLVIALTTYDKLRRGDRPGSLTTRTRAPHRARARP